MDGSRFDAWTRRRVGLVAGGALASLFGVATTDDAVARKKRTRCKQLFKTCKPGGKPKCCKHLKCGRQIEDKVHCCKAEGQHCSGNTDLECCDGLGCDPVDKQCEPVVSDRAMKANFATVDPGDVLARVRALPISTWNYTSDDPAVRHLGPMAQDFAAAFGVGADDRRIHPMDGQGVALAAAQGLAAELDRLRVENARLADRIAALEAKR